MVRVDHILHDKISAYLNLLMIYVKLAKNPEGKASCWKLLTAGGVEYVYRSYEIENFSFS